MIYAADNSQILLILDILQKFLIKHGSRARLKHYYDIIIPLSEGVSIDESFARKTNTILTGDRKYSIHKNSIKFRWIGLWLWDHFKHPIYTKGKDIDNTDYFFKAIKFRFDTEPKYKKTFLIIII